MKPSLQIALALSVAALAATAVPAIAQEAAPTPTNYIAVGPRIGLQLKDNTEFVIGAEGRFGLLQIVPTVRLDIRPQFNYYFESDVTIFDISADAIFAFDIHNPIAEPYAFAGLNIGHSSVSSSFCDLAGVSCSSTDVGLNLGGGARFLVNQKIQPYAELRFTAGNFNPILLSGGVLFIIR